MAEMELLSSWRPRVATRWPAAEEGGGSVRGVCGGASPKTELKGTQL